MFEGVGGCGVGGGWGVGRLGRLVVDDFCGGGEGCEGVRGCGFSCWPLTRSSRCLRVVASRVGGVRLWECEVVGRRRDTERCVSVTQHVVG